LLFFLPAGWCKLNVWVLLFFGWSETLEKQLIYYGWIIAKIFFENSGIQYYFFSEKFMHIRKNIGIASVGGLLGLRFVPPSIHSFNFKNDKQRHL
jgi:hypothetical protein